MQQLFSTFGINWMLLLAQAVNFGVLLAILWRFLYRPVIRIIDQRREKIAEGVRIAQLADHKLQDAKAESERVIGEAGRQAESVVAAARVRADERANEILREAQARSENLLEEAKARAEEAQRQALRESEREIARTAMLAAEKILREKHA